VVFLRPRVVSFAGLPVGAAFGVDGELSVWAGGRGSRRRRRRPVDAWSGVSIVDYRDHKHKYRAVRRLCLKRMGS
jgi:hypothetical protein